VKAVIATSFERIHRSNLVGMGVLPLTFRDGEDADTYGLTGKEKFTIPIHDQVEPLAEIAVKAENESGDIVTIPLQVRLDTPVEVEY
ncbi:MAG TPA: hypothetical protein D7H86_03365, partial [Candidatus Poseidoniales archaeon]